MAKSVAATRFGAARSTFPSMETVRRSRQHLGSSLLSPGRGAVAPKPESTRWPAAVDQPACCPRCLGRTNVHRTATLRPWPGATVTLHSPAALTTREIDGVAGVGRKPIPRPCILDACEYLGYIRGERRWRSADGKELMTWDSLHGEVEVFNLRGKHVGTKDAVIGVWVKNAVRGRRIDV